MTVGWTVDDQDYCTGKIGDLAVTGWIIRRKNGKSAYFQIEGQGGLCVDVGLVSLDSSVTSAVNRS